MTTGPKNWAKRCAVLAILATVPACSDLLKVENPDAIQIETLNDVELLQVQLDGVIDAFVGAWDHALEFATYATDEVLTGVNWEGTARTNQRIISYLEGETSDVFENHSRGLRMGNDVAERIRVWQQEDPSTDFNEELATALVFAGYSAVNMAEQMCQSVISPDADNPSGTVLEQPEIFAAAMPYLTEALSLATAAGVDSLANLARNGLARAHLGRAEWSDAATFAGAVTPGFEWWIRYVDISGGRNPLQNVSFGGNFRGGIHPWFTGTHPSFDGTGKNFEDDDVIDAQTDPRIQHETFDQTGHNGLTRLYKMKQGTRYSQYTGETIAPASAGCPACTGTDPDDLEFIADYDVDILLADYVEAQHHLHEAYQMQSTNEAAVLAFVNARRAVGNQAPVVLTGQALLTELHNQRGKDLFMNSHRLGDLRRWERYNTGNGPFALGSFFPTGTHPNAQWGEYGVWTCFPIPLSEYEGNPNLTSPLDPSIPPAI